MVDCFTDQNHGTSLSPRQDASCSTGRPVSLLACASEMTWSRRVFCCGAASMLGSGHLWTQELSVHGAQFVEHQKK